MPAVCGDEWVDELAGKAEIMATTEVMGWKGLEKTGITHRSFLCVVDPLHLWVFVWMSVPQPAAAEERTSRV